MRVTAVFGIEIEPWGAACILRKFNDRMYICICNVKSDEYKCRKKHAFVYDSHSKTQIGASYLLSMIAP